jgi:hypothetical protein
MRVRAQNIGIGALIAVAVFLGCVWYAPAPLALSIIESPQLPLSGALHVAAGLLVSSFGDLSFSDASYFALIAILIGANVALTLEYLQRRRRDMSSYTQVVGMFGSLIAILGLGCAACGSLLAGWTLGAFGLGSLLAILPLGGEELRFAGVALLALSVYLTIRNLRNPAVCPV